jgi:Ca2+-transporting ATPase
VYYLLSCNLAEVLILFVGVLLNWPLILLPVQLLWINLATDSVTALALGVEPKPKDIMRQKPRDPKESILPNRALFGLMALAIVKTVVVLLLFNMELDMGEGVARTMAFAGLIILEGFNLFNFKSFDKPLHKINPFDNPYLTGSLLLTLLMGLVVVQIPSIAAVFHLVPLTFIQWAAILGLGLIIVAAGELYKNLVYMGVLKVS